jgi:hypothetical protein
VLFGVTSVFKVFILIRGFGLLYCVRGICSGFSEQLCTSIFGVEMSKDKLMTSYRLVRERMG